MSNVSSKSGSADVVVVGGGIVGLCSAYQLAKQGFTVSLLEKRHLGSGASGCSAAMLECQTHAYRGEEFLSFARASLSLFPALHREILDLSGIDFQYENSGVLNLALSEDEASFFHRIVDAELTAGHSAEWLDAETVRDQFPLLDPEHFGAALYKEDGQVNAEIFVSAMAAAFRKIGGRIVDGFKDFRFDQKGNKVTQLIVDGQAFGADSYVVAAGAWTPSLLAPLGITIDIEPVKGQLLFYDTPVPVIPLPVFAPQLGYVVPKKSGFALVGTTVEKVGFDEAPTETAKTELIEKGRRLVPGLSRAALRGMSAGLRPGSKDGMPFIGSLPVCENVIVAAGHFRNGILLAPITAEIVADLVQKRKPALKLDAVSLQRSPLNSRGGG